MENRTGTQYNGIWKTDRGHLYMKEKKQQQSGMEKIATFIVDKRNLFFLLYIFLFYVLDKYIHNNLSIILFL